MPTQLPGDDGRRNGFARPTGGAARSTTLSDKEFSTTAAKFSFSGWSFWRSNPADGAQRFFASRWGRTAEQFRDLAEAERFLARVQGEVRA